MNNYLKKLNKHKSCKLLYLTNIYYCQRNLKLIRNLCKAIMCKI